MGGRDPGRPWEPDGTPRSAWPDRSRLAGRRSRQAPPRFPSLDLIERRLANAVLRPDEARRPVVTTDGQDILGREFRLRVPLTGRPLPSALANHVQNVVPLGGSEQMARIDASAVVAGVADDKPSWNWSEHKRVNHTMRPHQRLAAISADASVATGIDGADPGPAFIITALVDLFPEAFGQWTRLSPFTRDHCDAHKREKQTKNSAPQPKAPDLPPSKRAGPPYPNLRQRLQQPQTPPSSPRNTAP